MQGWEVFGGGSPGLPRQIEGQQQQCRDRLFIAPLKLFHRWNFRFDSHPGISHSDFMLTNERRVFLLLICSLFAGAVGTGQAGTATKASSGTDLTSAGVGKRVVA